VTGLRRLLTIGALIGCGDESLSGREVGARLASDPSLGGSTNPFACTTCHATGDPDGDRIYSGYTLADAAFRERFWGGAVLSLLDSVNFCAQFFMAGPALDPGSQEGRALYAFLESISDGPTPGLPLTVVENVAQIGRGSASRGEEVYRAACRSCHGDAATGAGRLPHPGLTDEDIVLPQWTRGYATDFPGVDPGLVVVEKVRHGQFFGVGGNMPLFAREMLSDEDLGALLSYLDL